MVLPMVLPMVLLIAAFLWGEGNNKFLAIIDAILASLLVSTIIFFTQLKWQLKLLLYVSFFCLLVLAFSAGANSKSRAYNECFEHGEEIRVMLQAYFQEHKNYPSKLSALNSAFNKVPCDRIFFPSILHYETTQEGYRLHFGGEFMSYTATQSEPFEAHK